TTVARAPLYSRLSRAVADDPELWSILLAAPETQRQPVLFFAGVHSLLIEDPTVELAAYYPNLADEPDTGDPVPAFRRFCAERRERLMQLFATRRTQTNEVGRCALIVPPLSIVWEERREPLSLLDVGASGGLNLILDRYQYVYVRQERPAAPRRDGHTVDPTFDVTDDRAPGPSTATPPSRAGGP